MEGKGGFSKLATKVRANGVPVLYHGSLAAWAATFVGHWPWFAGKAVLYSAAQCFCCLAHEAQCTTGLVHLSLFPAMLTANKEQTITTCHMPDLPFADGMIDGHAGRISSSQWCMLRLGHKQH